MDQADNKTGIIAALVVGLISFGFAPILVRLAPDTSPLTLVAIRTVSAALMLWPYWWAKRDVSNTHASSSGRWYVALAGICLGIHFTCWVSSLYYTSVASASVLVTIHPILVITVERIWFRRSFAWTTWLGVALAFGGSALLGIFDSSVSQAFTNPLLGNALAFSAAAIFVVYLFIGQKVRQQRSWIDYVFPVYAWAAGTCLVLFLALVAHPWDVSLVALLAGLGLALGPQIMGHGSMNYAIKYISPTLISTLILVEPLLASVLAFLLFEERPPPASLVAMVIILTGVGLTWKRSRRAA